MKNLTVLISGAPEGQNLRDLEIDPGTSAGDVLQALDLDGYLLSRQGSAQTLAAEETIYDTVSNGDKLRATPVAEVGSGLWRAVKGLFGSRRAHVRPPAALIRKTVRRTPQRITRSQTPIVGSRAVRVQRDRRPLWELRGWRREGNRLVGAYRTPRGSFVGVIDLVNKKRVHFFIWNPPPGLLNGDHSACFRKRGKKGMYFVHMGVESPEIDAGIVAIENLIARAI